MSIEVVKKSDGQFIEVVKVGVIKSEEEADKLFQEAQLFGTLQFQANLQFAVCLFRSGRFANPPENTFS